MSKKLQRLLDDGDKLESRIAEMQEQLRSIRKAQKAEEDSEILRSIRSTRLSGRNLLDFIEGVQAGRIEFLAKDEPQEDNGMVQDSVPEMEDNFEIEK